MHCKRIHSMLALAATLVATATPSRAQGTFAVRVVPTVIARARDSLSLTYTVTVLPGSTDSLLAFIVEAPGTTLNVVEPPPSSAWTTMNRWGKTATAEWVLLEGKTRAGQSTIPLPVSGHGVLGIVRYWAKPRPSYSDLETDTQADTVTVPDTVIDVQGAKGLTVGIVAPPTDQSPAARIARLDRLITQMCDVGWITDAARCARLHALLTSATPTLLALLRECDMERGKHVKEEAYLVLTENVRPLITSP
jgi:hypothetical protein